MSEQQRQHFRLRYPLAAQPTLRVAGHAFAVTELSEGGMRIISGPAGRLAPSWDVHGELLLATGDTVPVDGIVLRIDDAHVVVKLLRGPSYKEMLAEQRYVAQRYPDWPQSA
jgi:PilZ domain